MLDIFILQSTWNNTLFITIGFTPIITFGEILFLKRFGFIPFRVIVAIRLIFITHIYITPLRMNPLTISKTLCPLY